MLSLQDGLDSRVESVLLVVDHFRVGEDCRRDVQVHQEACWHPFQGGAYYDGAKRAGRMEDRPMTRDSRGNSIPVLNPISICIYTPPGFIFSHP